MSFFENTRKPVGFGGKVMTAMMNIGHTIFESFVKCQDIGLWLRRWSEH